MPGGPLPRLPPASPGPRHGSSLFGAVGRLHVPDHAVEARSAVSAGLCGGMGGLPCWRARARCFLARRPRVLRLLTRTAIPPVRDSTRSAGIVQILILFVFGLLRALPDLFPCDFAARHGAWPRTCPATSAPTRFWKEQDTVVREAPPVPVARADRDLLHPPQNPPSGGSGATLRPTVPRRPRPPRSRAAARGDPRQQGIRRPGRSPGGPTRLSSRLTRAFRPFSGSVIGGAEGADYVRAWKAKLSEVSNPVARLAHAPAAT